MTLSRTSEHVFIIDLNWDGKYDHNLQSILHEYGRKHFDLESSDLIVSEPSQANVTMMRKSIGIHFIQRNLGIWELVPRTISKSLSLEYQKIPPLRGSKICL